MWRWIGAVWMVAASAAQAQMIEDFGAGAEDRWRFITDGVMGGVSTGSAQLTGAALHLTGTVSTKNNGGFIQARHVLDAPLKASAKALVLRVRGNGERYTIFLRSPAMRRPWHNYKASFVAPAGWTDISLPFDAFVASNRSLPPRIEAADVRSIGVAAYGADFEADLQIDWVAAK